MIAKRNVWMFQKFNKNVKLAEVFIIVFEKLRQNSKHQRQYLLAELSDDFTSFRIIL